MSAVSGLAARAAMFMGGAGYSPGSRASYQRIWDRFEEYCAVNGVQEPDRETAARLLVRRGRRRPAGDHPAAGDGLVRLPEGCDALQVLTSSSPQPPADRVAGGQSARSI